MSYKFTKMHSLGNDFVLFDGVTENIRITEQAAGMIANRRFGIGCDQVLVVEPRDNHENGFRLRIFNSDGSEAGQCGNGARCLARFLYDRELTRDSNIEVITNTTTVHLELNEDNSVTAGMGCPQFAPEKIPLRSPRQELTYTVNTELGEFEFSALSIGNPHCILQVDSVTEAEVHRIGPLLECHELFPQRANIGFSQVVSENEINLRVYERGAGETLGCGSGACAAAVAGMRIGLLENEVRVNLPGGSLDVRWQGGNHQVYQRGPVTTVFRGTIDFQGLKPGEFRYFSGV